MNIIYILTIVILFILFILKFKKEERQNIVKWLTIDAILLMCYNIIICVILSFINIKSTLFNLSVINILFALFLGILIYKEKKIQKYYFDKIDILFVIIITMITIIISVCFYGIPMNIKNSITDSAVHYFVSNDFSNNSMLLIHKNSDILNLWNVHFLMPGAYINTGIILKIFLGIIDKTYFCQLYQIFNIFIWNLSGILMYILLSKNKKTIKEKILPFLFAIIYMLGYPLNSMISGFAYLSLALNIIVTILIIMNEDGNSAYKTILLFFLNFALMFSYYYFAPVVYFSILLQIIFEIVKNKEKILKFNNILNITLTLVIPGIFGILYFIVFQLLIIGKKQTYLDIVGIEGSIYENLIFNIIVFLILGIYSIIKHKNKIENKMFVIGIIFTIIIFIGNKLEIVSDYYFFKLYYMLWIFMICVGYLGTEKLFYNSKILKRITLLGIFTYLICLILSLIIQKNLLLYDIFVENMKQINFDYNSVSAKELELLEFYNKNINKKDNNTYFCLPDYGYGRAMWIYAITENPYDFINLMYGDFVTTNIEQFINSEDNKMVLFKQDFEGDYLKLQEDVKKYNLNILYENEEGMILEKF